MRTDNCPICGNKIGRTREGKTCGSKACIQTLRKQTCMAKYGVEFVTQVESIKGDMELSRKIGRLVNK